MIPWQEYHPSHPHWLRHSLLTLAFGGMVAAIGLVFVFRVPAPAQPVLWAATGVTAGILLILSGRILWHHDRLRRGQSPSGGKRFRHGHGLVVALGQAILAVCLAVVLWETAASLGMQTTAWRSVMLYAFVFLAMVHRITGGWNQTVFSRLSGVVHELVHALTVISICVFLAATIAAPMEIRYPRWGQERMPIPVFLVWLLAALISVSAALVFLHRAVHGPGRPRPKPVDTEPEPSPHEG